MCIPEQAGVSVCVHAVMWTSVCEQQRRVSKRENMIIFVWVNELLTRVAWSITSKVWEALLVCLVCTVCEDRDVVCVLVCVFARGGRLSRGHCLVKLKEERWHAVSLSWRSPLNALAPPDTFYSDWGDRGAPPACRGIPPFNWAFTQDSFHSPPRASPGADKTTRVTKLGLALSRLRGSRNLDLHKELTFTDIIPVSQKLKPY